MGLLYFSARFRVLAETCEQEYFFYFDSNFCMTYFWPSARFWRFEGDSSDVMQDLSSCWSRNNSEQQFGSLRWLIFFPISRAAGDKFLGFLLLRFFDWKKNDKIYFRLATKVNIWSWPFFSFSFSFLDYGLFLITTITQWTFKIECNCEQYAAQAWRWYFLRRPEHISICALLKLVHHHPYSYLCPKAKTKLNIYPSLTFNNKNNFLMLIMKLLTNWLCYIIHTM